MAQTKRHRASRNLQTLTQLADEAQERASADPTDDTLAILAAAMDIAVEAAYQALHGFSDATLYSKRRKLLESEISALLDLVYGGDTE